MSTYFVDYFAVVSNLFLKITKFASFLSDVVNEFVLVCDATSDASEFSNFRAGK